MTSQEPKKQERLTGEIRRDRAYAGKPGQTHDKLVHYTCQCGTIFSVSVFRAINVQTHREQAEAAVAGNLNRSQCPFCNSFVQIDSPYVLHHPEEERFVLVIPEHQRHRELAIKADVLLEISQATDVPVPPYVSDFQVVFGTEGLRKSLSTQPGHVVLREELAAKQKELEERERTTTQKFEERERTVTEAERLQAIRESQLGEKELAVEQQEESVMMREERLKERGENVTRMEDDHRSDVASHQARVEAFEVRVKMIEQREADLVQREGVLNAQIAALQEKEAQLEAIKKTPQQSTQVSPPPLLPEESSKDIVSSLMRDPDQDELTSEQTQERLPLDPDKAGAILDENDDAEELTDDDLIEEEEEITDDVLIEGQVDLASTSGSASPHPPSPPPTRRLPS